MNRFLSLLAKLGTQEKISTEDKAELKTAFNELDESERTDEIKTAFSQMFGEDV